MFFIQAVKELHWLSAVSFKTKGFREAIRTIYKDLSTVGYETEEIDKLGHHHTVFTFLLIQPLIGLRFNWGRGQLRFLMILHSLIDLVCYNIFKITLNIVKSFFVF